MLWVLLHFSCWTFEIRLILIYPQKISYTVGDSWIRMIYSCWEMNVLLFKAQSRRRKGRNIEKYVRRGRPGALRLVFIGLQKTLLQVLREKTSWNIWLPFLIFFLKTQSCKKPVDIKPDREMSAMTPRVYTHAVFTPCRPVGKNQNKQLLFWPC